jgi:hypothetical protein
MEGIISAIHLYIPGSRLLRQNHILNTAPYNRSTLSYDAETQVQGSAETYPSLNIASVIGLFLTFSAPGHGVLRLNTQNPSSD